MSMSDRFPPQSLCGAQCFAHVVHTSFLCAVVVSGVLGAVAARADDKPVQEPAEQVAQKQAWLAQHGGGGDEGGIAAECSGVGANLFYPFSATDGTWTLALSGNDDGSTSLISLPFAVSFFGESFPGLFINNNGNVTFGAPNGEFSSTGFPASGPKMIAAFWADVDTRPAASGKVWRKSLDSNGDGTLDTFVVTWDNVGYFNQQVDKLNTFQIILTDGTNQVVGLGTRAAFSFENMCWTTGSASNGSNGFGGIPATVGVNRGNGIDFFQVGLFNQNNASYDGPGGANDGVDYLDGKFLTFSLGSGGTAPNVPPVCTNLPVGNAVTLTVGQTFDTTLNFIPPEATQTTTVEVLNASLLEPLGFTFTPSTPGSLTTLRVQWTPGGSGVGVRSLQLRATDNAAAPASSDFTVSFSVSPLPPTNVQASDGTLQGLVRVTWNASAGATSYDILRRVGSEAFTTIATVGDVLQYFDASVVPSQIYGYAVRARGGGLASQASPPDIGFALPLGQADVPIVSASSGTFTDRIRLVWTPVSGATAYEVSRGLAGSAVSLGITGTTSFDDLAAPIGQLTPYRVRGVSSGAFGAFSEQVTGWRAPAAPSGVNASDGTTSGGITVSWVPVLGAREYEVLRAVAGNALAIRAVVSSPPFLDADVLPGVPHLYAIRSRAPAGGGPISATDIGFVQSTAGTPAAVSASDDLTTAVRVTWAQVVVDTGAALGYKIYRRRAAEAFAEVGSSGPTPSFVDATAVSGVNYDYAVRALLPLATPPGAGVLGPISDFDTGRRAVGEPLGVQATGGTRADGVEISWIAVAGAVRHSVLRAEGTSSAVVLTTTQVQSPFIDFTAVPGVLYSYAVIAHGAEASGPPSSAVNGWCQMSAPTGVTASDGTVPSGVSVAWAAAAGASAYRVSRAAVNGGVPGPPTVLAASHASLSFSDMTAVVGTPYLYTLQTIGVLPGALSQPTPPEPGHRLVPTPSTVQASDGTSSAHVRVIWSSVTGSSGFDVLRAEDGAPLVVIGSVGTISAYDDASAVPGRNYRYALRTLTNAGPSVNSAEDVGFRQMTAPQGVSASDGLTLSGVDVTWSPVAGAVSYQVRRGTTVIAPAVVGTTFTDSTAAIGTLGQYSIRAVGSALGALSAPSASDPGYRNRSGPSGAEASDFDPIRVRVTWTAAPVGTPALTGIEVRRTFESQSPVVLASSLPATTVQFDDVTGVLGVTYLYEVRGLYTLIGSSPAQTVATLPSADFGTRPFTEGDGTSSAGGSFDGVGRGNGGGAGHADAKSSNEPRGFGDGGLGAVDGQSPLRGDGAMQTGGACVRAPKGDGEREALTCELLLARLHDRLTVLRRLSPSEHDSSDSIAEGAWTPAQECRLADLLNPVDEELLPASCGVEARTVSRGPAVCALYRGDMNLDGEVDGADFALFMDAWRAGEEVLADLDRSGVVDAHDLAQMLAAVGGE